MHLAVVGTETESRPLIDATERLTGIECVCVPHGSSVEGVDAVACCGSHENSVQAICDFARSGMHLLVNLAALRTTTDAETMVAECGEADVQLMIVPPRRLLRSVQAVRQSLDANELGEPGLLRIHNWVTEQDEEIDQLLLHELDLAIYLYDGPPTTVYSVAHDSGNSRHFVQVHLGFEGGGMALIDVTTGLPEGDNYYSLSLIGANGSAYADDHHNAQLLYCGGPAMAERTREHALDWTEPLRQFAAAIDRSRKPAIGADSALAVLSVMSAARRCVETGSAMRRQGGDYERV